MTEQPTTIRIHRVGFTVWLRRLLKHGWLARASTDRATATITYYRPFGRWLIGVPEDVPHSARRIASYTRRGDDENLFLHEAWWHAWLNRNYHVEHGLGAKDRRRNATITPSDARDAWDDLAKAGVVIIKEGHK